MSAPELGCSTHAKRDLRLRFRCVGCGDETVETIYNEDDAPVCEKCDNFRSCVGLAP